jgi:hypothetical protein
MLALISAQHGLKRNEEMEMFFSILNEASNFDSIFGTGYKVDLDRT